MLKKFLLISVLAMSFCTQAQPDHKAQVAFLGLFHFANPGLDKVKTKQMRVTSDDNQTYLVSLSNKITNEFNPTHVLIECARSEQKKIESEYQAYLEDTFTLSINENHQIGFRVAKTAKLNAPICYDEREIQWQADALMNVMPAKAPKIQSQLNKVIQELTTLSNKMHATMSLQEILITLNEKEAETSNKSLYILTNSVGAGDTFEGADAAASWWHRNFRMYANVQRYAQPNNKVLVLGGSGHTAILKDLLALDSNREAVDIKRFL